MSEARSRPPAEAVRLRRRATTLSVAVGTGLAAIKITAWLMTGSVSLLASLLDSFVDIAASLVALVAVRLAVKPADTGHRYGHGKAEGLGALFQAGFIGASALFVGIESVHRFIHPAALTAIPVGLAVMAVSILLTLGLVAYQRHVIRRTGSLAVGADSLHYQGDLAAALAVILALGGTALTGWRWLDPAIALAVAAWLGWSAAAIARRCIDQLMDRELPEPDRTTIARIVEADPDVVGWHDLRTRQAGATRFAELHLELDGHLTLETAHDVADRVVRALHARYPDLDVTLHQEPAGIPDSRLDDRIRRRGR